MVSEDSQHLGRLSKVHRLDDFRDLNETSHREVRSEFNETTDVDELGEIFSLRGSQRVCFEERDDHVAQVSETKDLVLTEIFTMIVMPAVGIHLAAAKKLNHRIQDVPTRCTLDNGEGRLDLPAQSHRGTSKDGNAETAFTVYKTHQPFLAEESFLLIVRTGWIFTADIFTLKNGCDIYGRVPPDTRGFQHMADCSSHSHL
jgi:hypothetical protein